MVRRDKDNKRRSDRITPDTRSDPLTCRATAYSPCAPEGPANVQRRHGGKLITDAFGAARQAVRGSPPSDRSVLGQGVHEPCPWQEPRRRSREEPESDEGERRDDTKDGSHLKRKLGFPIRPDKNGNRDDKVRRRVEETCWDGDDAQRRQGGVEPSLNVDVE